MKLVDKIFNLIQILDLSKKEFCKEFEISQKDLNSWELKFTYPKREDVICLCKKLNLSLDDFIDDLSTVTYNNILPGEHIVKGKRKSFIENDEYVIREDNARYEEKD